MIGIGCLANTKTPLIFSFDAQAGGMIDLVPEEKFNENTRLYLPFMDWFNDIDEEKSSGEDENIQIPLRPKATMESIPESSKTK